MLPWLRFLLVGVLLRFARGVTEPPLTTATPAPTVASMTIPAPIVSTVSTASNLYLTDEPWFPYRELILECLMQMSWPCTQRKMIVYLDQLNRARSVSVVGDLLTLVKVRADNVPPITEALLTARKIEDQDKLYNLLELAADRFIDSHVLRLNLPFFEGNTLHFTPLDVNFVTAAPTALERTGRGMKGGGGGMMKGGGGKGGGGGGGKMKMKGGKMMMKMMMMAGKKMMMMMGKIMLGKMMMMVPIAMKKGMIGGMAGLASMGMMKMMLIQKIISMVKSKVASCGGGGGGGSGGGFVGGFGGGGGGGGGGDCGGGGGGGDGGYGGGGGGWDRNYNTNSVQTYSQPYSQGYSQIYNQPYTYYYRVPQGDNNNDSWSLWKRR